MQIQTKN